MEALFIQHLDTLTNISYDKSNGVSMIMSDRKIINFDHIQETYFKMHGDRPLLNAMDGLWKHGNHWYFIEFKNGVIDTETKKNIRGKVLASLLTFYDILSFSADYGRKHIDFILIYNDQKNEFTKKALKKTDLQNSKHRNQFKRILAERANQPIVFFKMNDYKDLYFHQVFTWNVEQYKNHMKAMLEHECI